MRDSGLLVMKGLAPDFLTQVLGALGTETQEAAEEKLNIPESTLSKLLRGKRKMDVLELLCISEVTGIPPEKLLDPARGAKAGEIRKQIDSHVLDRLLEEMTPEIILMLKKKLDAIFNK